MGIRPRFQRKYALLAKNTNGINNTGVANATTVYAYTGLGHVLDQQSGLITYKIIENHEIRVRSRKSGYREHRFCTLHFAFFHPFSGLSNTIENVARKTKDDGNEVT